MTPTRLADALLARRLATRSGDLLLDLRAGGLAGRPLGQVGDRHSHEALLEALAAERPDDRVLSEEGPEAGRPAEDRLTADRVWIIDPLDGTREYGELDRADWAVHVALWERGALVAGAVALPALGLVLGSDEPPVVPAREEGGPLRVAVSRTRPPAQAALVAERLGADLVPLGSAGYKVAAVLLGEVDAYVHAGGQYEWDSAAPVAVAAAAGLHASRLDGSPLAYNRPDPLLPDLLVCRPELAPALLDALNSASALEEDARC